MSKLDELKKLLLDNATNLMGFNEKSKNIAEIVKEIANDYDYSVFKELINIKTYGNMVATNLYLSKEQLNDTEFIDLLGHVIKNNLVFNCVKYSNIPDVDYNTLLRNIVKNETEIKHYNLMIERLYILISYYINNDYYKIYNNGDFNYMKKQLITDIWLSYISENKNDLDNEIFKELLNREDVIKFSFCNADEIDNNDNSITVLHNMMLVLDKKDFYEEPGIYSSFHKRIYFNNNELNEIYIRYKKELLNILNNCYYENCFIFADCMGELDKIEFIEKVINNNKYAKIDKILKHDTYIEFLNEHIELKDRLDAVLIMNKLTA